MKKYLLAGLVVAACASSVANATTVLDTGADTFGDFGHNESVLFNLTGLGSHTEVKLNFDLYVMDSWDGSDTIYGPDVFGFKVDGVEQSWTFRNISQDPGDESNIDSTWDFGNFNSVNKFGEIDRHFVDYADGFTIAHTSDTLDLELFGFGLQAISDESWRVENITLTTSAVPVPAAVWLFGSSLFGLIGMRRKAAV